MPCTMPGCDRTHYAHGVCVTHYRARRRAAGIDAMHSRREYTKTCDCCGLPYTTTYRAQRYCDRTCRDIANLLTGQQAAASIIGVAARPPAQAREPQRATECTLTYGVCRQCGALFAASPAWGKVYCSRACKKRAYRLRLPSTLRNARGHRRHALTIHERDHWTCWLCGTPTSPEWTALDPLAPTLDHLIPRVHGGTDDPDNLGTAHAICNSRRGAETLLTLLPIPIAA